jgi:hypothetical protein
MKNTFVSAKQWCRPLHVGHDQQDLGHWSGLDWPSSKTRPGVNLIKLFLLQKNKLECWSLAIFYKLSHYLWVCGGSWKRSIFWQALTCCRLCEPTLCENNCFCPINLFQWKSLLKLSSCITGGGTGEVKQLGFSDRNNFQRSVVDEERERERVCVCVCHV